MQIFSKRKRNNGTIFSKRKRNNGIIFSKRKRKERFLFIVSVLELVENWRFSEAILKIYTKTFQWPTDTNNHPCRSQRWLFGLDSDAIIYYQGLIGPPLFCPDPWIIGLLTSTRIFPPNNWTVSVWGVIYTFFIISIFNNSTIQSCNKFSIIRFVVLGCYISHHRGWYTIVHFR